MDNLSEFTPKKLRTLRNQLNNRIESFKSKRIAIKELPASHKLAGMSHTECLSLLEKVKREIKAQSRT